ncbi:MAG: hypothetical protein WCD31_08850 [Gillisia sp.]
MSLFKVLKEMLARYFTRRRLLVNGISLLVLASMFLYMEPAKTYLAVMFASIAFIYFGFYTYYTIQKKSVS